MYIDHDDDVMCICHLLITGHESVDMPYIAISMGIFVVWKFCCFRGHSDNLEDISWP